jgi:hypothetical protein
MADKRTTPEAATSARHRRRASPTIDLSATEIESKSTTSSEPPQQPLADPPSRADSDPAKGAPSQVFLSAAARSEKPGFVGTVWAWARDSINATTLAAGLAGAVIVSFVMFALWMTGMVPIRYAGTTTTRARVSLLEMEMRDLREHPAAANKTTDTLAQRVGKLEETIAKLPASDPATAGRLSAADNAMKSLGIALTALNRRNDDVVTNAMEARSRADAAAAALDALDKRVATLESAAKTASEQISKNTGADIAARLALSAAALRDVVLRGMPFAVELAAAKSFGGDNAALAPLEPFAASGVPSDTTLARELGALIPAMLKASGAQPDGNFFERLQANAGNLVRIRPVDEPPGNDPAAVLARIEIKAVHADISGALSDLAKLSDKTRASVEGWISKAKARQAALEAARKFAADTARALGKP